MLKMDDRPPQHTKRFSSEPNGLGDSPGGKKGAPGAAEHQCVELCPICRTADVLRASLPPEFQEHWQSLQREAMLAMRTALDHYIDQLDDQRRGEPPIEDIPIG